MPALQFTTSLIGLGLAVLILVLLRRDHLYIHHGLFWIVVAALGALLGLWPGLIDRVAQLVGISYAPAALLLGAVVVLFIKALYADMMQTRLERQLRRLNQRVAMLELGNVRQGPEAGASALSGDDNNRTPQADPMR
jgi:hypothetical protein